MKTRPESLEELIWEIRRAFRELTVAADRELRALAIEAGDRAFLEFLARETEAVSLSELARKYSVSRQHIHQTLRRLPHPEWVEEIADSADRRIVRLQLSEQGRACWERIRAVDRAFLSLLAGRLPQERVEEAAGLLRQLRREIRPEKEIVVEQR
jgi:DNA-binding MarR family transcriptional regulator